MHHYDTSMDTHMTNKERLWTQTLHTWHHTSTQALTKMASQLLQEGCFFTEYRYRAAAATVHQL